MTKPTFRLLAEAAVTSDNAKDPTAKARIGSPLYLYRDFDASKYGTDWDTTFCESGENAKVTTGNCELVAIPKFSTAHGRALHWHKNTSRTIIEKYSSLYREYFATVKYNEMYNSMETMTTQDSKDPMQKASEYPPAYV